MVREEKKVAGGLIRLTPHFLCVELLPPNIKYESLSKVLQANGLRLAKGLEALREDLNSPLVINTYHRGINRKYAGFRTKFQNDYLLRIIQRVNASLTSLHKQFLAGDVVAFGKTPKAVAESAKRVGFTEIIVYNTFTHVAFED